MAAHQASLFITNSRLPKLMSTESVMSSNHLILCCSLLLMPSIFLNLRVSSNESVLGIRWPKYWSFSFSISSVQFRLSVMSDSLRLHELQHSRAPCPSPAPRVHPNLSIESVIPSRHLILCHPLLLLPPIPPSIRVFSNESTLPMRWPKYWSFSFSIIPSKEIPGLISFRMDWLELLAVQGTLKSLLQHHRSKASILRH